MDKRPHLIPALIAAIMLVGALAKWPYGYYTLLRIVVCGTAVFSAFLGYATNRIWAIWPFGAIALLFNPLISVHLKKDTWQAIDLLTAIVFVVGIFALKYKQGKNV